MGLHQQGANLKLGTEEKLQCIPNFSEIDQCYFLFVCLDWQI